MSPAPTTLTDAAASAVVPPDVLKLQNNAQEMGKMLNGMDTNRDGKLSVYEILNGMINSPRFVYILIGLISSLFGIYRTIQGFASSEWDSGGIIFSGSLIIAAMVLYVVLKNNNQAQVMTVRQINEYHENRYDVVQDENKSLKDEISQTRDELNAWKHKAMIYQYQAKAYNSRHPEDKFPDITTLEN